jgi:hypothetical protein
MDGHSFFRIGFSEARYGSLPPDFTQSEGIAQFHADPVEPSRHPRKIAARGLPAASFPPAFTAGCGSGRRTLSHIISRVSISGDLFLWVFAILPQRKTMLELPGSGFKAVTPLLAAVPFDMVFVRAVVRGFQSGRVFADDPSRPSVALVWHSCGAALLCGGYGAPPEEAGEGAGNGNAAGEALRRVVHLLLAGERFGKSRFRLYCHPETWNRRLSAALGNRLVRYSDFELRGSADPEAVCGRLAPLQDEKVVAWTRVQFAFDEKAFFRGPESTVLADGFSAVPIDSGLFEKAAGTVVPKKFWDSAEHFRKGGFGFCLVTAAGGVASTSFAAYVDGEEVDVGIETDPAYRGRGLAERVCRTMIESCLERGLRPVWGCRKDNLGSRRLARKLGFSEIMYHPAYFGVLPPQPA